MMQTHRRLAVIVISAVLAISGSAAPATTTLEAVQIAFAQKKLAVPDIAAPDPRGILVVVDFAAILHIEGGLSVIAVGNPDIADASLVNDRTVIVTGRVAGTTNLIALDSTGNILADVMVRVSSQKPGMVSLRRGTQVELHRCPAGLCEAAPNESPPIVAPLAGGGGG